jgi:hypothetical protein
VPRSRWKKKSYEEVAMDELVDRLGNKRAGQLIKSEDWNGLVAAIEELSATVDARFASIDDRLEELAGGVDALAADFGGFRQTVEPLLGEYYRLTMETARSGYAIGELAEITARVTDLRGESLDLTNEEDRPWIDFVVASWGQLKPASGFESLGGAGDRAISVRTDAQGIARVLLRSDHAEGFTDEDEAEVAVSLETTLPTTNISIAQTILSAATPIEAKEMGAFRTLTTEYDRTDAVRVRNYADAYFSKNTALITGVIRPLFTHRWLDYRSTVMAFARRDGDPLTPDQSRGVSSLQVTFRDWIAPWIITDYFVETSALVENFRDRLVPKITSNLGESVVNVRAEVGELVLDRGLIGRQRDYRVIRGALDELTTPQPPAFLNTLTRSMQNAISVQQALESAQGFADQEVAFAAFADAALRTETNMVQVREDLTSLVQQEVSQAEQTLRTEVRQEQQAFRDSLLAEDGPIRSVENTVTAIEGQVNALQGLDVTDVKDRLSLINGLENRLTRLERGQ